MSQVQNKKNRMRNVFVLLSCLALQCLYNTEATHLFLCSTKHNSPVPGQPVCWRHGCLKYDRACTELADRPPASTATIQQDTYPLERNREIKKHAVIHSILQEPTRSRLSDFIQRNVDDKKSSKPGLLYL